MFFSNKKLAGKSFELRLMHRMNKIAIGLFVIGILYKVISYLL